MTNPTHPLAAQLIVAFGLLTRLPLPAATAWPQAASTAWAWPLAGAVVGGLAGAAAWLAMALGVPAGPSAALALIVQALLTGGLHEDGLADAADGLYGGHTPERRLEIMKDSRIGSYGALALGLVTLLRWSALAAICAGGAPILALVAAGAASRTGMALVMAAVPGARPSGLSHGAGRPGIAVAGWTLAVGLCVTALASGTAVWAVVLAVALVSAALARTAVRRIGGQTGDILGAVQQVSDAACLVAIASLAA